MPTTWRRYTSLALALGAAFAIAACESPDPESVMNSFREAALSDAGDTGDAAGYCGDVRPTPDGVYFCALSANLDREKPLYMELTFTLDGDELTVDAQPLVRDFNQDGTATENPRTAAGDLLPQVVTTYNPDGTFFIDWPGVTIVGDANPLTFRDLGGDLNLEGLFLTDEVAHGAMGGQVTNPTVVPLAGSTFACERTDDPTTIDPVYYDDQVAFLTPCPPEEGSGMEGSGS